MTATLKCLMIFVAVAKNSFNTSQKKVSLLEWKTLPFQHLKSKNLQTNFYVDRGAPYFQLYLSLMYRYSLAYTSERFRSIPFITPVAKGPSLLSAYT